MKKLLARTLLAIGLAVMPAAAWAKQINALVINRTDGISEYIKLGADLNVVPAEDGGLMMTHPQLTVIYAPDDVENYKFDEIEGDELYRGDHQLAAEAPEAPRRNIEITADAITADGVEALELFDTAGRRVRAAAAAADGKATLGLGSLPKGIYILRAGSTTMKIKI